MAWLVSRGIPAGSWSRGVGIYLWHSDNNLVIDNELLRNRFGIRLSGGATHNFIVDNEVKDGADPDPDPDDPRAGTGGSCPFSETLPATGIWVLDEPCDEADLPDEFFPTPDNTISDNEVTGNAGWGIDVNQDTIVVENEAEANGLGGFLAMGSGNTIMANEAEENFGDGFRVLGTANLITDNEAAENTGNGFKAAATSSGNTFSDNESQDNAAGGFDDDSPGPANFYSRNTCNDGSDPSGLCTP